MKQVAKTGISILGIYLIVESISDQSLSFYSLSSNAMLSDYLWAFGPSITLLLFGIFFLLYRDTISYWLLKEEGSSVPIQIDLDKIELIIISLLGIMFLLETIPNISMTLIQYFFSEEIKETENISAPIRDYAIVQASAVVIVIIISGLMTFFPQKIQSILHKTRRF